MVKKVHSEEEKNLRKEQEKRIILYAKHLQTLIK